MEQGVAQAKDMPENYLKYTWRKTVIIISLVILIGVLGIIAICAGSADLTPGEVVMTLLGWGSETSEIVIWNIRLPRVVAAIVAGAGLAVAGCVLQNILRNRWPNHIPWNITGSGFRSCFCHRCFRGGNHPGQQY